MKKYRGRVFLALLLAPILALAAASPATSAVAHKVLDNGLEVFVVENHSVPLATVCVVFRGGAIAHTPASAGLFHLYEHMLFAANEKYPNQAAFTAALNRMGVPSWNGSTGTEHINYYITLPSARLEEGIEFWSWAVEHPVFDPDKLENEKGVVINEIRGYHTDPDQIMEGALESRLYPAAPWRKNIDGPEENIAAASVAELEAMRRDYYIPKNTALLVGGDVSPARAFELAEKWFGDWQGGDRPVLGEPPQGPFPAGIKLAYADDNYYEGVAELQLRWRGPDVLRQTADTYTADVLLFLLSSPVGRFKQTLMGKGGGLYDPEYISFGYPTSRDGGAFYFSTFLLLGEPERGSLIDRAEALRELLLGEFELISKDPAAYFGAAELEKAKAKLIDANLLSMEVASSFLTGTLSFWWSVATTDYFFGYEKACGEVSFEDISSLIARYLTGQNNEARPSSALSLRFAKSALLGEPDIAERMEALGYEALDPETAFWWQAGK